MPRALDPDYDREGGLTLRRVVLLVSFLVVLGLGLYVLWLDYGNAWGHP
jgi:hypothetical protein